MKIYEYLTNLCHQYRRDGRCCNPKSGCHDCRVNKMVDFMWRNVLENKEANEDNIHRIDVAINLEMI